MIYIMIDIMIDTYYDIYIMTDIMIDTYYDR